MAGAIVCPTTPIAAVAIHDAIVNQRTHGLWRLVVSEIAPNIGIETITSAETSDFAIVKRVIETPMSLTIHAARKRVPIFIENIVLEKSYIAQLRRSRSRAVSTAVSPASGTAVVIGSANVVICCSRL